MFTNNSLSRTGTSNGSAALTCSLKNSDVNQSNLINKNDNSLASLSINNPSQSSQNSTNSQPQSFNFVENYGFNRSTIKDNLNSSTNSNNQQRQVSYEFNEEQETCINLFDKWSPVEQIEFTENLLRRMCHFQHGHINNFLKPMLQRDFISSLPAKGLLLIAETILSYLDAKNLCAAELVCKEWLRVISDGMLWKKLIERQVNLDPFWKGLSQHRGWSKYLFKNNLYFNQNVNSLDQHKFYKNLYFKIIKDKEQVNQNWHNGMCNKKKIHCRSENSKGVYCLQYDNEKIISGLRDNTIKVWDKKKVECTRTLSGHTGSVLCLQYDQNIIVSGSSDTTVRIWDIKTGENVQTLHNHKEAVLHLRFMDGLMVTCSKDRQIIVWDMHSPQDIQIKRTLVGHRAAVNVVDFDSRYIVSASGDRSIKVWHTTTCEYVRTLNGHKRGIACLQYRGNLVVSGSSDFTIRLWDIEVGECLRILEGHDELVRCIRFDNNRIVSGAYDGKIKIWDLKKALDQRTPTSSLCIQTLVEHSGRVFRLQFDEFQIVSSSHDDTIIIWDFLNDQSKAIEGSNDFNGAANINSNNTNNNQLAQSQLNSGHMPWLSNASNLNLLNNQNNSVQNRQNLSSPSTSPCSQRRNLRAINNQNSPPSPMEGDD